MRILFRIIKYILAVIILAIVLPYLLCQFYQYPEIKPFSGNQFYNPYSFISSLSWNKANFHAHTRQWGGITAGGKNDEKTVAQRYREIRFNVVGISDYQDINTYLSSEESYVPVYEHGYGFTKTHQLVIGAEEVSWKDYIIFQTFHNKQDIIQSLKNDDEVISINHPKLRNAYSPEAVKYLRGYDLIEISSHSYFNAADIWDSALSAGNPVFGIGNDDNHDINDPADYGYVYNMIDTEPLNNSNVKSELREGRFFVVELEPVDDTSPRKKIEQSQIVPVISKCEITADNMLKMKFTRLCDTLLLIGQNGVLKEKVLNTDSVYYLLKDTDTYIRAEIHQANLTRVYLNPVFRYNGTLTKGKPEIDLAKTWLFRAGYIAVIAVLVIFYRKRKRKKLTDSTNTEK